MLFKKKIFTETGQIKEFGDYVNLTISHVISPQNVKTVRYSSFLPMSHLRQCCAVT